MDESVITEFITKEGTKVPAITVDQMKEIDRIAIEETGPNLYQMMENAGRNLAELTISILGRNMNEKNILVLAGTSGNGGGGICAARHLANRGYQVKVCIPESQKLKGVPEYQLHVLKSTSAKIISVEDINKKKSEIIIDALIGYSLNGYPKGKSHELIRWLNEQLAIIISLDVPSGIDATTGNHSQYFVKPDLTLMLGLPKTGLLPEVTGELFLGDISIPHKAYNKVTKNFISPFKNNFILKLSVDLYR